MDLESERSRVMSLSILKDEINEWRTDHAELTTDKVDKVQKYCVEVDCVSGQNDHIPSKDILLMQSDVVEEVLSYYNEALPEVQCVSTEFFNCEGFLNKLNVKIDADGYQSLNLMGILRPCVSFRSLSHRPDLISANVEQTQEENKKQKKAPQPKEIIGQASQPSKVEVNEKKDKQGAHMTHVLSALKKLYRVNNEPMEYYSFVLDPSSFSVTVKNMFIVSILLQSLIAKLQVKDNGEMFLIPLDQDSSKQLSTSQTKKNQIILSLNPPQYKKLLKTLKIVKPKIPPWNNNG